MFPYMLIPEHKIKIKTDYGWNVCSIEIIDTLLM